MLLLSLDEIDRVKRMNRVESWTAMEDLTHITRKTWAKTASTRRASWDVMEALVKIGARPDRLLVSMVAAEQPVAA